MKIKKVIGIFSSLFLLNSVNCLKVEAMVEECPICLEDIKDDSIPTTLSCGHKYHRKCIANWFSQPKEYEFDGLNYEREFNNTCPFCRHEISEDIINDILKLEGLKRKRGALGARLLGKLADLNHWLIYNNGKKKIAASTLILASAVGAYYYLNSHHNLACNFDDFDDYSDLD